MAFKQYMRECRRCKGIYKTPSKRSKICPDCWQGLWRKKADSKDIELKNSARLMSLLSEEEEE